MPSAEVYLAAGIMLIFVVCSGLISGSEVAFFSISAREVDVLRKEGDSVGNKILQLLNKPRTLLAIILIANNFINVAIVMLSYYITLNILKPDINETLNFIITTVSATFILVLFGEVLPKVYATKYNMRVARLMAYPLKVMQSRLIFGLPARFLVKSGILIEKRLEKRNNGKNTNGLLSAEELEHAIDITTGTKSNKQEVDMLKGIVNFGNTNVKQVMCSRMDVVAAEINIDYDELLKLINDSGYSRIPIYEETIDNIKGILYVKDLLEHLDKPKTYKWNKLIRPPEFAPETKKIDDLLKEIQRNRVHLVVVVDEYGGTSGIVTLEDILEEVIGEIQDEYDQADFEFKKLDEYNYIFEGKTLLNDVCKVLEIKDDTFDKVKGDSDSLAGLVLELSGKIPEVNEQVGHHAFLFTVMALGKNRIEKVKVTIEQNENVESR